MFIKFINFYDFLIKIGTKYGFIHNDLHFGNIFYNLDIRELILIDYGRSSFKYFMDINNSEINNKSYHEFIKLGYEELLKYMRPPKNKISTSLSSLSSSKSIKISNDIRENVYLKYCNMKKEDKLYLPFNKSIKKMNII